MMMIKKLRVGYAYACPPRWMIIMTNIMVVILDVSNDDDDDDVDDDDEGGTCLGKYSKGSLLILKRVADVLFSQAIPETIAMGQMLSSIFH